MLIRAQFDGDVKLLIFWFSSTVVSDSQGFMNLFDTCQLLAIQLMLNGYSVHVSAPHCQDYTDKYLVVHAVMALPYFTLQGRCVTTSC